MTVVFYLYLKFWHILLARYKIQLFVFYVQIVVINFTGFL